MNTLNDLIAIAPLLWVVGSAILVLLLTVAGGLRHRSTEGAHLTWVALIGLAGAACSFWHQSSGTTLLFSGALSRDGVSSAFGFVIVLSGAIAILNAVSFLKRKAFSQGEFIALVLLSIVGMLTVVMSIDLMSLFLGIEMMSLAIYVLAGYRRDAKRSQEAAFKYFIYGAFASAVLLMGIALMYGEIGRITGHASLYFSDMQHVLQSNWSLLTVASIACLISGFAFKVGAAPMHMWAPDVYEGSPTPSTAFMAVGVKAAVFAVLCRFVLLASQAPLQQSIALDTTLQFFAITSMFVGNLIAIRQNHIKRMLAYSSVAHAGYLLVGIIGLLGAPSAQAVASMAYYLLGYSVITLGALGVVALIERKDLDRRDLTWDMLAGLSERHPVLAMAMAVFMIAFTGIPPTIGFFGKLGVLSSAIAAGHVSLSIVTVLASAIGAYYYLRVLVVMYMKPSEHTSEALDIGGFDMVGLALSVGVTLFVGLCPSVYLNFAQRVLQGFTGLF